MKPWAKRDRKLSNNTLELIDFNMCLFLFWLHGFNLGLGMFWHRLHPLFLFRVVAHSSGLKCEVMFAPAPAFFF